MLIDQRRVRKRQCFRLKGISGGPTSQFHQRSHHRLHSLAHPNLIIRAIGQAKVITLFSDGKLAAITDDRRVFHQRFEPLAQRVTTDQQHAGTVQMPHLQRQTNIEPGEWVLGRTAVVFPQLILHRQRHSLPGRHLRHNLVRQSNAAAFGRLQDGLSVEMSDRR